MSALGPDRRIPERFRFWQGQALTSRDLNDVVALAALMKGWHNRALHDAFGVAEGLAVRLRRDGTLTVEPGTAYDLSGCPLELRRPRSIAAPVFAADRKPQVLVLRRVAPRRDGACWGDAVERPPWQELQLRWVPADTCTPLMGVPLAVVEQDSEDRLRVRLDVRPPVRAEWQPRIGFGTTIPGESDWQLWSDLRHGQAGGLQLTVDTSATGFTRTPCYFAWLQSATPTNLGFFAPYWERIVDPEATRFTFSLWIHRQQRSSTPFVLLPDLGLIFATVLTTMARRELSVCWLGIEADPRVAPSVTENIEGGGHVIR